MLVYRASFDQLHWGCDRLVLPPLTQQSCVMLQVCINEPVSAQWRLCACLHAQIPTIGQAIKDAVTRYQQNDQVKKQARLHKDGRKEGQQRPQKRQKQQRGTDWVGLNFVKPVTFP